MGDLVGVNAAGSALRGAIIRRRQPGAKSMPLEGAVGGEVFTSAIASGRSGLGCYLDVDYFGVEFKSTPILPGFPMYSVTYSGGETLESLHMPTLDPDTAKKVKSRLGEGKSGTPMRLNNTIISVLIGIAEHISHPCVRLPIEVLKWFVSQWGSDPSISECDDPPHGNITVRVDSMSPKKVYMCINLAMISSYYTEVYDWLDGQGIDSKLMLHEMLSYYSASPTGAALKLKGSLAFAFMHASALATAGTYISVQDGRAWSGYVHVKAPSVPINSSYWKEIYGPTHLKHIRDLSDMGLSQLSKLVRICIRFPLDRFGYRATVLISALRAFLGYTRTDNNVTFREAYSHAKESPVYKGVGLPEPYARANGQLILPHTELLRDATANTFTRLFTTRGRRGVLPWPSFVKTIYKSMTANSAGCGNIRIELRVDGVETSVKTTAKSAIYPLSPDSFRPGASYDSDGSRLTIDTYHKFFPPLTISEPGQIAERSVTAKASRPIVMQPLWTYIAELYLYLPLYSYVMFEGKDQSKAVPIMDMGEGPDFNNAVFTIGTETGNELVDHYRGFVVTGNAASQGLKKTLLVATDYSSFDQTEVLNNFRIPWRDGIIKAFRKAFGTAPIGAFDSIETLMEIVAPLRAVPFKLPNGSIVWFDGIRSGEYLTMCGNNAMNASVCQAVRNAVSDLGIGEYTSFSIQGDDVLAEVDIVDEVMVEPYPLSGTDRDEELREPCFSSNRIVALAKTVPLVVNRCGLETNADKGTISLDCYDYLKKRIKAGRSTPPNYLQAIGAESLGMVDLPGSFVIGQIQKLDLYAARGADPHVLFRYSLALFLLRCSYRVAVRGATPGMSSIYYPPFSMYFSPTSLNGLGRAPFTCPSPSNVYLVYLMKRCPAFNDFIMAHSPSYRPPGGRDYPSIVASLILSADKRSDCKVKSGLRMVSLPPDSLTKPYARGVADIAASLDSRALEASMVSADKLKSTGRFKLGSDLLYQNTPKRSLTSMLRSNAGVIELTAKKREAIHQDSFIGAKKPTFSDEDRWIQSFIIREDGEVPVASDPNGPMCAIHPSMANTVVAMGWGCATPDAHRIITSILTRIKADPVTPRDITEETLSRLLLSPEVASDPSLPVEILSAIGCSEDTKAYVGAFFTDESTSAILLSHMSGSFTLNAPLWTMVDRSRANLNRFVEQVSSTKASSAAYPAMVAYMTTLYFKYERPIHISYSSTKEAEDALSKVRTYATVPFVPILEMDRRRGETGFDQRT